MKIPAIAAVAAALAASAMPAQASQIAVGYSDLNLSSAEGRATLEKRIQRAAREVCGMDDAQATGTKVPSRSRLACFEKATSSIGESIARAIEKRDDNG